MKSRKLTAIGLVGLLGTGGAATQAAVLQPGDVLTIGSGSWFGLDMNLDTQIASEETTQIYPGPAEGVIIGGGISIPEFEFIDTWTLFGATGHHYTTVDGRPTGSTEAGLDFSGWSIFHDGVYLDVVTDYGAWTPSNCASLGCSGVSFTADVAALEWSGVYGDSYSLWYSWVFQEGAPGAFTQIHYLLHLEGVVVAASPVPLPPALWLFGAGLAALGASLKGRFAARS